jgi:hypothetical protein
MLEKKHEKVLRMIAVDDRVDRLRCGEHEKEYRRREKKIH